MNPPRWPVTSTASPTKKSPGTVRLHRFGRKLRSVYPAGSHLRLVEALRARRHNRPAMQPLLRLLDRGLLQPAGGSIATSRAASRCGRTALNAASAEPASAAHRCQQRSKHLSIGSQIDLHRLPRPPIRRGLQNRRPAQPPMRDQQLLPEPLFPDRRHHLRRNPAQIAQPLPQFPSSTSGTSAGRGSTIRSPNCLRKSYARRVAPIFGIDKPPVATISAGARKGIRLRTQP